MYGPRDFRPSSKSIRFQNAQIITSGHESMDRFLVESPHKPGECKKIVKNVFAQGYLYNCDWGCTGEVHKA